MRPTARPPASFVHETRELSLTDLEQIGGGLAAHRHALVVAPPAPLGGGSMHLTGSPDWVAFDLDTAALLNRGHGTVATAAMVRGPGGAIGAATAAGQLADRTHIVTYAGDLNRDGRVGAEDFVHARGVSDTTAARAVGAVMDELRSLTATAPARAQQASRPTASSGAQQASQMMSQFSSLLGKLSGGASGRAGGGGRSSGGGGGGGGGESVGGMMQRAGAEGRGDGEDSSGARYESPLERRGELPSNPSAAPTSPSEAFATPGDLAQSPYMQSAFPTEETPAFPPSPYGSEAPEAGALPETAWAEGAQYQAPTEYAPFPEQGATGEGTAPSWLEGASFPTTQGEVAWPEASAGEAASPIEQSVEQPVEQPVATNEAPAEASYFEAGDPGGGLGGGEGDEGGTAFA